MKQLLLDFNPLRPIRLTQVFRNNKRHFYVFSYFQAGYGTIRIDKVKHGYSVGLTVSNGEYQIVTERVTKVGKMECLNWATERATAELSHGTL